MSDLQEINIVKYLLLSVFTFGLFYLYWQYRQMSDTNTLLKDNQHGFFKWFFLSILTFGIYHLYHEYKMSQDIITLQERFSLKQQGSEFPLLCLLISLFGLILVSDFIHQDELNKIIRASRSL